MTVPIGWRSYFGTILLSSDREHPASDSSCTRRRERQDRINSFSIAAVA
jgi:hypothetical protein